MQTVVTATDPVAIATESNRSGVSWGAIFAGAAAAAALTYVLVILGFGLGLSSVSPWSNSGVEAETIGIATILWLSFTALASSGMGGYLAGRLRTRWGYIHDDEVYFRDTAHGFLSWAVASLVVVAFLASAVGGVLSSGASVAGSAISGAGKAIGSSVSAAMENSDRDSGYFVDSLFRSNGNAAPGDSATSPMGSEMPADSTGSTPETMAANGAMQPMSPTPMSSRPAGLDGDMRAEAARIMANAVRTGSLSEADRNYLAQVVASQTGLSEAEAQQRVDAGYASLNQSIETAKTKAKEAADAARKAAAKFALWSFVTLLLGAFFASLMAIFGGRRRDASVIDVAYRTVR